MRTVLLVVGLTFAPAEGALSANQPTAGQAAPAGRPAQAQPATAEQPATPELYSYQPDGRRDPFISVIGSGNGLRPPSLKRGDGAGGITVAEVSVRGVIASKGTLLAMIQSPDKKTYVVHAGDKLMDGTIKSITPQGLVIVQDVNDPLSLVKQREVRKLLRTAEDSKQ
jgi:Tfp pilus assembly protein PilP